MPGAAKRAAATKKKPATPAKKAAAKAKVPDRLAAESAEVLAAFKKSKSLTKVAEELGISTRKARRLYALATLKPSERVTGTDKEVGKAIARLRDEEGLPWAPDLWARTGFSLAKMRKLYEEATGRSWKESGSKRSKE